MIAEPYLVGAFLVGFGIGVAFMLWVMHEQRRAERDQDGKICAICGDLDHVAACGRCRRQVGDCHRYDLQLPSPLGVVMSRPRRSVCSACTTVDEIEAFEKTLPDPARGIWFIIDLEGDRVVDRADDELEARRALAGYAESSHKNAAAARGVWYEQPGGGPADPPAHK